MRIIPQNPVLRVTISAIAAFFGFGIWAYLANYNEGHYIAMRAAWVQGSLSFVFTLVGSAIMEFMVRLSEDNLKRFLMAVITNMLVVYGFVIGGHLINGTPNLFLTILPGLIITSIYCLSYSWFLTYGHAAGGDYKMVQLVKMTDTSQLLKAEQLIVQLSEADTLQARRIVDDIEMGRKSSVYLKDKQTQKALIEQLKPLGIIAKEL